MEKFYLEEANIKRKEEAIEYIKEHIESDSEFAGDSGLADEYENYEAWLEKLELMKNKKTCPSDRCLGKQYFLIREDDNRLIGMINLRWDLSEWMIEYGGNIGYGIRPTERNKGYNKINLYLCLLVAKKIGLDKVILTALDNNIGSIKTILSLGGKLDRKIPHYKDENLLLNRYFIDVNESIKKYSKIYEKYIRKK